MEIKEDSLKEISSEIHTSIKQNAMFKEDLDEEDALYTQLNMDATNQYVVFSVGNEEYGIPILSVQEIISLPNLTQIPNTPDFIPGVINLRGTIIPLFELRRKFKMKSGELGSNTVVIIVQTDLQSKTVGLIVDNVSDVLSIAEENLKEMPDLTTNLDTKFIEKMGQVGNRLIIIIKLASFFSEEEMFLLSKSSSNAMKMNRDVQDSNHNGG